MFYLESFTSLTLSFITNYLTFLKDLFIIKKNTELQPIVSDILLYVNLSSAVVNITIYLLLVLIILNFIYYIFFQSISYLVTLLKFINLFFLNTIIILLTIKFYFSLKLEQHLGPYLYDLKLNFFLDNNLNSKIDYFIVFSSSFSDSIIILSFITGLICLELLGSKNLFKNINNISLFYIFNIFVLFMVSTTNLLVMFISFECIFLPTIYFVYKVGYSKKVAKANEFIFYWTLLGSFSILCILGYLYYNYNTLNYIILQECKISSLESKIIFIVILLGFGVKVPLAPFHFWLLRVHVESPTAFSIFLSGFLVKSALYCLFIFLSLFSNKENYFILTGWIFYSLIIATFGLARQVDIKKLIAWATIQEMTFMLLFLVFKQMFLMHSCVLFIILHGLMSSYMFYIVDILQRRFKTRAIIYLTGLHLLLPKLTKHIWFLILLFSGFPLTAKFFIEWNLISIMVETKFLTLIYVILLVNFAGSIFFCKIMFTLIYGVREEINTELEEEELTFTETQKKEYNLLNYFMFFISLLTFLIYII